MLAVTQVSRCRCIAGCCATGGHAAIVAHLAGSVLLDVVDQGFDILEQKCVSGQSGKAVAIILLINECKNFWG
jgi:hypothetical protein